MNKKNVLEVIKVRFPSQIHAGTFLAGSLKLSYGQKVVAMSDRGMAIGYVHSTPFNIPIDEESKKIKYVHRIATDEDIEKYKDIYQEQRAVKTTFENLAREHNLEMTLKDVEFTFYGKKVTFFYTAPGRVDFRDLLKSLRRTLKLQIELKQIAEDISGPCHVGPCGAEMCQFINSLMENDPINKKRCNEYHCRLDYKDPFYEDKRSRLPKVGELVRIHNGDVGRVERLDLWQEEFELLTDQGIRKRYVSAQLDKVLENKSVHFPKHFDSILNETRFTIGKEALDNSRLKEQQAEQKRFEDESKAYAEKIFKSFFE